MNHIKTADYLAMLLDNRFEVVGIRFGIDPLLNFVPIGGSAIGMLFSMYILWIAQREGVPLGVLWRMVFHVVVDFMVGLIPFVGWVGDVFIKANLKNLKLLHEHVDNRPIEGRIIAGQELLTG